MGRRHRRASDSLNTQVTGFDVSVNVGEDARQTAFRAEVHLIPRRHGDVETPRGGVRGVIRAPNASDLKTDAARRPDDRIEVEVGEIARDPQGKSYRNSGLDHRRHDADDRAGARAADRAWPAAWAACRARGRGFDR